MAKPESSRLGGRPPALNGIKWAATALGVAFVCVTVLGILNRLPDAWYSAGGQRVPRQVWLRIAAPVLGVAGTWLLALAAGLWRGRRWARHCAPGLFISVAIMAVSAGRNPALPAGLATRALLEVAVFGAASGWYFYRYKPVVMYFRNRASGAPRC